EAEGHDVEVAGHRALVARGLAPVGGVTHLAVGVEDHAGQVQAAVGVGALLVEGAPGGAGGVGGVALVAVGRERAGQAGGAQHVDVPRDAAVVVKAAGPAFGEAAGGGLVEDHAGQVEAAVGKRPALVPYGDGGALLVVGRALAARGGEAA